jgi:ubiquitin carboxyl-terminal hydrolase 14
MSMEISLLSWELLFVMAQSRWSTMPTVSVKWQKQVFNGVEIDTEQLPYVFKCQLYDLTGVPPERQKIMVKGGLLKDDGDWESLGIKEGQRLMLMGTAEEIPKAPEKGPVFVEDLPEDEQGTAALGHTAGLVNLGNTCYMNSTLQCLHSVPELRLALKEYSAAVGAGIDPSSHSLTAATRDLFGELDRSLRPVAPVRFLTVLRSKYPQFAQQTNQGLYMQQDAEECWTQLLYVLSQRLQSVPWDEQPTNTVVKHLFGIEFKSIIKCEESGEESSESETVYTLKCHISSEVNHLHEGLKHGLKSELEKTSPILGRSTLHIKESWINKLPPYLTVQFVRFFWKRESNQKAKILRKVNYPLVLDVLDFCTEELKEKLKGPRKVYREIEDAKVGIKKKEKEGAEGVKALQNLGTSTSDENVEMVDAEQAPSSSEKVNAPEPEVTGIYDLVAVLTHKGRSADSGHYVAWVKQDSGKWIEFDDEQPILQREEDITKLSGGGDWHMAYICLYKARVAPPY